MNGKRTQIEQMLEPGGASKTYVSVRKSEVAVSDQQWFIYALLSSISSAIRERAADQALSLIHI